MLLLPMLILPMLIQLAPADHLADPFGFSVGSDDAPANDSSSVDADPADADVNSDPVRNLDTVENDQASPAPADHLADPVGISVGSDDAPADGASSPSANPADADVVSTPVRNLDTAEHDQARLARLTTLLTLLAFRSDLMTPRRTMPLLLTLTWIVTKYMTRTRPRLTSNLRSVKAYDER
uniref:Secreted protein n=1 Tax=Peronospora matthiolae TaxID=2874970 RepID=A0AAV1UBE3_9STRA